MECSKRRHWIGQRPELQEGGQSTARGEQKRDKMRGASDTVAGRSQKGFHSQNNGCYTEGYKYKGMACHSNLHLPEVYPPHEEKSYFIFFSSE